MLSEWFSITRTVGLIAYTVTLAACLFRWMQLRKTGARPGQLLFLAAVQFMLLLDMAFDWRWRLHEYWMRQAITEGVYSERRGPQLFALVGLAVVIIMAVIVLLSRFRRQKGLALAFTGTLLSIGLCAGEAISYHYADIVLHATIGGAMMVSFLWCGLCAITCLGLWVYDAKPIRL
jgi:hypothetical protein